MNLVKKKSGFPKLKRKHKNILLMFFLLLSVLIVILYELKTISSLTIEDQMKEYSDEVSAPLLKLDIKFENYQNLLYQRKQALMSGGYDCGFNFDVEFSEVPARFSFMGKKYKADIELKGLRKGHYLDSTKMSYHVKLKNDQTIMGMRKFSLHDPKHRNYIYEWLFHTLLKREGFIALKYDFIEVAINGEKAGVYAIEERIDKILLERYGYLDGPVFKLADDADKIYSGKTEIFAENKYSSELWKPISDKAFKLAEEIKQGRKKIGQLVNADMLAKYFALCDVFMFFHGSLLKSLRFYYNQTTGKFEPIGFDGHTLEGLHNFVSSEVVQCLNRVPNYFYLVTDFNEKLFMNEDNYDPEFLTLYVKYLDKYSKKKFIDDLFKDIGDELTYKLAIIYKDHPLLKDNVNYFGPEEFKFSTTHIYKKAQYIRKLLQMNVEFSKILVSSKIYRKGIKKKSLDLLFSNNYSFPLVLEELVLNDSVVLYPEKDNFIVSNKYAHIRNYKNISFFSKNLITSHLKSAKLGFKIAGMDSLYYTETEIISDSLNLPVNDIIRKGCNINEFNNILQVDESRKEIRFREGSHIINNYIKIPEGYKVILNKGTNITLKDSAFILSYSPLDIKGTESNPVIIKSDQTGGIAVFDCDSISIIQNAVFEGLSNPHDQEWKLTGAVTFYKSPVFINKSMFINNMSEDQVNIKLTDFKITNSHFENISSDAFDSDFSNGLIENCSFKSLLNDAVDISGGKVKCKMITIDNSQDKAISAGEGCVLTLEKAKIINSEIGIASKDNSKILASEINIKNCKVGYTAYQKKSEFGPGYIESRDSEVTDAVKAHLIEKGSKLKLNGKMISGTLKNVAEELLYGKKFGSKTQK